jgi:hypothetical protein
MYWGNSSPPDADCGALTASPLTIHVTIRRVVVQGQLEGGGKVYTVACTAYWVGSGCGWLIPGDTFGAEVKGTTMWVDERRSGNAEKPIRAKYRILDIRPVQ